MAALAWSRKWMLPRCAEHNVPRKPLDERDEADVMMLTADEVNSAEPKGGSRFFDKLSLLSKICKALLEWDPDIVEIIQFGSSVYASTHARDIDLIVVTKDEKAYGGYFDASNSEDSPFNVDVLIFNVRKPPRPDLLRNVLGAFKVLYGDGTYLLKYAKALGDPTFDEARAFLKAALDYASLAKGTDDPLLKDRRVRQAFDALFHAARVASMAYLSMEVDRRGLIKKRPPEPFRSQFEEFIATLHLMYFYNGEYPRETTWEEFQTWIRRVEEYVNELEKDIESKKLKRS